MGVARGLAIGLAVAWLAWSAALGGIRSALSDARAAMVRRGVAAPGQPDARTQWSGPFFDALAALERERLDRKTTIAVVLRPEDVPSFSGAPPARMYEAVYRLYPVRPDFWEPKGGWSQPRSSGGEAPEVPAVWDHDFVLWASGERPLPAATFDLIYESGEVRLYRRGPR